MTASVRMVLPLALSQRTSNFKVKVSLVLGMYTQPAKVYVAPAVRFDMVWEIVAPELSVARNRPA